jgi:hypothetical protein
MPGAAMTNHLYYGDNLAVLRDHVAIGSVDPAARAAPGRQGRFDL